MNPPPKRRSLTFGAAFAIAVGIGVAVSVANAPKSSQATTPATVTLPDGLKYTDVRVGKGAVPKLGQTATVHYVGTFQNGEKFDSSRDRKKPFEFPLGEHQVIPCWDEGIATMHVGGRRKLVCPPDLAYGAAGAPGAIPPNATLNFDIELLGVR